MEKKNVPCTNFQRKKAGIIFSSLTQKKGISNLIWNEEGLCVATKMERFERNMYIFKGSLAE